VQLEKIRQRPSMFSCSVSAKNVKDEMKLKKALALLTKEDPSIVN
jgi:translation elongation factor EF-G